jgi:putative transcriptional regulator
MTPITLRLRDLRRTRGWSQSELARRSGVSQSVISRLENGVTEAVSFENLERLAGALECDPGYLVVVTAPRRWAGDRKRPRS